MSFKYPTAVPSWVPSFKDVFDVSRFGAVGDGVTDDTAAIQAAINAAGAHAGTVWFPDPSARYGIYGTLTQNFDGVWFRSPANIPRIFGGAFVAGSAPQLLWRGSVGGGPVIDWGGTVTTAIKGGGIENLIINGNGAIGANYGLRIRSAWMSSFNRVHTHECANACLYLSDFGNTGTDGNNNVYKCGFYDCSSYSFTQNGTGLLIGTTATNNTAAQGSTHCVFNNLMIDVRNAVAGIDIASSDDLWFYGTNIAIASGGTAHSIELRGADGVTYFKPAIFNAFFGLYPGGGGIFARAGATGNSHMNWIFGLSYANGTEPAPTIEAGASLMVVDMRSYSGAGTATGYAAGATAATFHSDDTYTGNYGTTPYTVNGLVAALKKSGVIVV